ncbi:MAG: Uma2 family endonuclease [Pirellulaceae bacterium]|jgi:Uma2 family endonuclease|nr:Uma2 family endonuclease [Pirellulaceae bacterium]
MQLVIQLPTRDEQIELNRRRWSEVLADSRLADLPYRIETNAYGELVMNPPPSGSHSSRQGRLTILLDKHLSNHALPECPISTIDGVKAADVGWYSAERFALVEGQQAFEIAPEICVEILSPSNTIAEMQHKRQLYFEAGAEEVWQCDHSGQLEFYKSSAPDVPVSASSRCPNFPLSI